MKRKPIILALALLLVVSSAFAKMPGKAKGMKGQMTGENCQILTEEEREKVADAKRNFEKIAIPLRADIKVLKMELDELVLAGKTGKDLTSKLDELNAVKAKLSEEKLGHQVEVRKIVGEDKYKQMQMFKHHMMHNKMGGQRGGKHGGKMKAGMGQGDCRYPDGPRYK